MNFGIDDSSLHEIKREILKKLGKTKNAKLYIYGSRVKGGFREFSDIDLLLIADSFDERSLSCIDFSELDIPFKVDFVLASKLFEPYKNEIYEHMVEIGFASL